MKNERKCNIYSGKKAKQENDIYFNIDDVINQGNIYFTEAVGL